MRTNELVDRTAAFCRQWNMLPPAGGTALCAVSGGRDSMTLLHILMRLAEREGGLLRPTSTTGCGLGRTGTRDLSGTGAENRALPSSLEAGTSAPT